MPMNINEKLQLEGGTKKGDASYYRSLVGANYLTHSKPNIIFPVSIIFKFVHSPTRHHFGVVRRILWALME